MKKNVVTISGYKSKFQNFYAEDGEKPATLYFILSQKTKNGYENHECIAFRELATKLSEVPAGKAITVTGRLSSRLAEKDGKKTKIIKIMANSFDDYKDFKNEVELEGTKGKYQNAYLDNPEKSMLYFQVIQKTKTGFESHDCIAFGDTARKIAEIEPSTPIEITGKFSTRLVEKNGEKEKVVKVIANNISVHEKKAYEPATDAPDSAPASTDPAPVEDEYYTSADDDFIDVEEDDDIELPFN